MMILIPHGASNIFRWSSYRWDLTSLTCCAFNRCLRSKTFRFQWTAAFVFVCVNSKQFKSVHQIRFMFYVLCLSWLLSLSNKNPFIFISLSLEKHLKLFIIVLSSYKRKRRKEEREERHKIEGPSKFGWMYRTYDWLQVASARSLSTINYFRTTVVGRYHRVSLLITSSIHHFHPCYLLLVACPVQ